MAENNQGFAAVVAAIERLRDTAYSNTGLRVSISRNRLLEERKQTDEIKRLFNLNKTQAKSGAVKSPNNWRDSDGRYADGLATRLDNFLSDVGDIPKEIRKGFNDVGNQFNNSIDRGFTRPLNDFGQNLTNQIQSIPKEFQQSIEYSADKISDSFEKGSGEINKGLGRLEWSIKGTFWRIQAALPKPEPTKQQTRDTAFSSALRGADSNSRAIAVAQRLAIKEQTEDLIDALAPEKMGPLGLIGGAFTNIASAILLPIEATIFGAFEGLGDEITKDFAEGFMVDLQKSMGLSLKETGGDFGKILGNEIYRTYEEGIAYTDQLLSGQAQFNLVEAFGNTISRFLTQVVVQGTALGFKAHRRIQLNKKAIPQAQILAGKAITNDEIPESLQAEIQNSKSITLVVGGQNTDPDDIGKDYAGRLFGQYMGGSAVIPVKREWTNQPVGEDFERQARNLLEVILGNAVSRTAFGAFMQEEGAFSKLGQSEREALTAQFEGIDLDTKTIDGLINTLMTLLQDQNFSLGKALEATFKGFNPDDVMIAAEAVKYMSQNPGKPVQIVGWSQGGYQAAGAVEILNRMGYQDVKGVSVGTPITGLNFTGNPENFQAFMGEDDFYYKAVAGLVKGYVDFPENFTTGKGQGKGHSLPVYLGAKDNDLKGLMQSFFGADRVNLPRHEDFRMGNEGMFLYAMGEMGADSATARTILKYLGVEEYGGLNANRGFIHDSQASLPGYRGNVSKFAKKVKNPEVKQQANEYEDYLATLQTELELAEKLALVGLKYKPVESLRKAVKFFPQLEGLLNDPKLQTPGLTPQQIEEGLQTVEANKPLIAFRKQMVSQRGNIERTFQAMLGKKFTKKDEDSGIYSFYNAAEYEKRANEAFGPMVDWLENNVLAGASANQKGQADIFLDFLKRLKQAMLTVGETGQVDVGLIREAEQLFGIDLREYDQFLQGTDGTVDTTDPATAEALRKIRKSSLRERSKPLDNKKAAAFQPIIPDPIPTEPEPLRPLDEFQAWIEGITQESIALAKENIQVFLQGFQQLSPADKKNQIRDFSTEINQIVQEFRTAIADGDNQLALDLLESGIRRIEQIREIYNQLSDPSLGLDTSALNLRSAKGALTTLRNELLTGQPNMSGRSPIGGEQLVSQAEAAAATGDSGAAQFLAELQSKIRGEADQDLEALKLGIGDIALAPVREFSASAIAVFDALSVAISKYLEPVRQSHLMARLSKLDDSLAQAKEMASSQSVTADASKPMVFAVGGLMGFGGKGGDYWQKHLEALGINQENANIEYPDYTHTDSNVPLTNPVGFVKSGVGNIIRNHSEGQNPDAIALASKVIAFREQNPDTPVNLLGHSAGADVVSEAIAILERGGYQGIKGTGVAGVDYGAQLPTENYRNLPGENDVVVNALRPIGTDRSLTEFGGMTATRGHGIGGYRRHPEFIARLDESLQATAALNALKDYLSQFEDATGDRLAGALEDARAFAQQFKEVFTFEVEGSPVDGLLTAIDSRLESLRNDDLSAFSFGLNDALNNVREAGGSIADEINKLKATIAKDLEYFRAVATGDTAKAQAMVEQAAKGSGYNVGPVYHGTKREFNEFSLDEASDYNEHGKAFYFAEDKSVSDQYGGIVGQYRLKGKELYESDDKPLPKRTVKSIYKKSDELYYMKDNADEYLQRALNASSADVQTQELAQAINVDREERQDAFNEIIQELGYNARSYDEVGGKKSYAVWNPNNIKSFNPITQTDDGKPVPLSARFDDSVSDIRGNVTDIFAGLKAQAGEALQPLIAELETSFAAIGDNSVQSLIDSLESALGQLRGIGGDVGDSLAQGTEDALDIDSPSKVYKAIGQDIIAGLESGLEGFEGTLEEKRKLLDTYVKSVIELVYDLPKVTGEATTQAQKVRKLFQDIGQAGTATTQQLEQAKGYFPELGLLPSDSPAAATYQVRKNKILVNPDRQEQLPDDLMHEYSHALQGRFGLGTRWANKAQDYLREQGVLGRRAESDDPRVKVAAGRSAKSFMDQMGVNPESRQYQAGFDHIYGAETEAYANELGIGKERKRRGFFKADAEEIAAQIKAARAEAKKAALELKEAGKEVTEAIGHGFEEGKQFSQDVLANVMDWLENIPILGLLVKLTRGIGSVLGGMFQGKKATPQAAKQEPPKQTIAEAMQSVEMPEVVKPTESLIKPIQETAQQVRQKAEEISNAVDQAIEEKLAELETVPQATETAIAAELDTKQIADKWLEGIKAWLKELGQGFESGLGEEITKLKADGANVAQTLRGKIDNLSQGLDDKKAQFRQAIADGNAELSQAIGTELLAQSEELRVLFKTMAQNVKFFEGRGMWRDQAAEMTKLQKEVTQGYPNLRGRADTGIYQAIASGQLDPNQQALKTEIPFEYVPVSYGMEPPEVQPVTVELEPGALEIPEPEPVAVTVEPDVQAAKVELPDPETLVVPVVAEVEEDGGGFPGFLDTVKEALDQSDTVIGDFISGLSDSITSGMDALEGLYQEVKGVFPGVEGVKDLFVGLGIAAGGAMVIQGVVGVIGMLGGVSLDALVGLESLERAFLSLTGSSEAAERSMKFARDEAKRLGVDLQSIEEAYMGLTAATRGTALEGSATDAILKSFAETASLRGLTTEQQGNMFTALQQVIGKRKLSAEEVRQQLGEIPGLDFQGTLARAMGISVGQLDDLMSSGQLLAEDVLPQVAAQYAAENAVVAGSSETTGQAIARFNNSLLEFQRSLQSSFSLVKPIFNGIANLITWFAGAMPGIIGLLARLGLVMAWGPSSVLVSMLKTQVAGQGFAAVIQTIGTTLARILPTIGKFLAQMVLMELAFDALGSVVDVIKSPFEEWDKSIQKTTKSVEALEAAYAKLETVKPVDELGGGWSNRIVRQILQPEMEGNLPVNPEDVMTSDTWNLFGFDTGMNLEFARKGFRGLGLGGKTLGQRRMEMTGERVNDTVSVSQRTLALENEARADLESIKELDRQLARVQLKRMDTVAGDQEAYNAILAEEKALQERRKEILDKTATFQQGLQDSIETVKTSLAELETQRDKTEITSGEYQSSKSRLELELEALEASRDEFEKSASSIQVASNALALALQKLNENYAAFNENMERQTSRTRAQFLSQSLAANTGSTVQSMGLSALESNDLTLRVTFLREQLGQINSNLSDPEFARQLEELRQESEAMGVDVNNSATLDRIAGDVGNKYQKVAETLKRGLELETELAQTEEQLAQSSVDMEQSLFDLSNIIADFFQQLTQQFEEARIELDRVKNQLKYGGLKQKLQQALVPGSNSFINGIIGSIQGIFDQAASVMESVLGQRQARLSFAGEKYSLDNQMTDFARSVNGATQAVEAFRQSLAGGQATLNNAGQSGAVATRRGGAGNVSGTLGYIGSTGASTGPHLDLRGFTGGDRQTRLSEARLKQLAQDFEVGGKPLSSAPITSGYGMRTHPTKGIRRMHPGLDYGLPMGTPITYKGQAVKINQQANLGDAGNTIEIVLPTGEIVQLLHLQKFGQAVIQSAQTAIASNANTEGGVTPANNKGQAIAQAAAILGINPLDLATIIEFESNGDKDRWNKQGTHRGLIQFGAEERKKYGYSTSMTFEEQVLGPVVRYFQDRFKKVGMSTQGADLLTLYRTVLGGNPKARLTATDSNGTSPQSGVAMMTRPGRQRDTAMQKYFSGSAAPVATNVSTTTQPQPQIIASTPDPVIARAQQLTNQVVGVESAIVDGNGLLVKQQIDQLLLQIQQEKQAIERQSIDGIRMAGNTIAESRDAFADLMDQYSPQTLTSQAAAELRQVNATVRQQQNELFERRREQEDTISAARRTIEKAPELIAELQDPAKNIDPVEAIANKAQIDLINSTVQAFKNDLIPAYEKALAVTKQQETELKTLETTMQSWLQTQAKQRQLNQDGEMIALRASVAQASFNEQLKLTADLQAADNEFEKQRLQLQLQLSDQPELLKEVLAQLEQERDAKKQNLQYDFDALIRGRELEALSRRLGVAQTEFNLEKTLSLEIAQAELEAENNRLKILQEIRDEAEQSRQLELNDAEKLQKIRQSELNYINAYLARKQADRDLDSRIAENAANLSRNPFAATQLREDNAIANRMAEFDRRAEEIRQTEPADRAASMIAEESEILAQDLELIDREFRDLSETIGDNIGSAFMAFSDALINGDNALQAFTNSLLKAVSDIGSQLMQQGIQGLMQSVFGKSGAIGGLFGGGASPGLGSFGGQALVSGLSIAGSLAGGFTGATAMLPFADGGYTGDGGKYEPKGIVHGGEFVINKEATRKIGLPALMSANALGQLPGYATGGYVGSVESRLLSGLNSTRMPSISLPTENRRSPVTAGPVSNTVNVNINDRESRFYKQSRTLARELADELRG